MKKLLCFLTASFAFVCVNPSAWAQDNCSYSLAFQQIRGTLGGLSALAATKALQAFAAKPQSAELCEATALDDALGEKEKQLVTLVNQYGSASPAQAVFRCNVLNAKTAQCQSPYEDGTTHPNLAEPFVPLKMDSKGKFDIRSQLPEAQLYAVYLTTLNKALNGKPAKQLATHRSIQGAALAPNTVLIAIYKTRGANKTWAYHKAVWYF
jgi:hypothetical protein